MQGADCATAAEVGRAGGMGEIVNYEIRFQRLGLPPAPRAPRLRVRLFFWSAFRHGRLRRPFRAWGFGGGDPGRRSLSRFVKSDD